MKTIQMYVVRLTGKQITIIIAALVRSGIPGAKELAIKLLERVGK